MHFPRLPIPLYEIAQGLGCEVTKWQPEEEERWWFNPEFLESSIQSNTKLVMVNFPHNPTRYFPSRQDFDRIIEIARAHNLYLFSDEMYYLLEYDSSDRLPATVEVYDQAVSLFGMPKTFGMAGIRLGWVVTKNRQMLGKC